jgi:ketosteroid isomerase-like protein
MENAYASAANARDAESVVNYYAEDAKSLPQNEPMLDGKSAILERLKQNYDSDTNGSEAVFEVVEVFAAGNLVIEIGKSTETDSDGKITTGKYMSIFENRDGKLVCIRDIWNNDAPDDDDGDDGDSDE